ncbi:right-handed parallel beta-helix repeat-containing protein, partial [bacterium]|nr:right-handed parallel beta-helix repeat-containing protein [bacterium]
MRINRIGLAKGASSKFRLNVDGTVSSTNNFIDIEIGARDSMYIFVETTINTSDDNNPVLIEDSVVFEFNGNKQQVLLEAFGQNMYLLKNELLENDIRFKNDKPYLIYGDLVVDTAKTLTLPAGCKLYFHNNSNLIVYGNLRTEGTYNQPVELRGDRLDKVKFLDPVPYNYVAGQWGGVYLLSTNGVHSLKNTNITSAYVGLYSPNSDRDILPEITVENCRIHNFVYYGIVAQNTNLTVKNSEISNTGSYTVFLSGGKHVFEQSTIANHYANNDFEPSSRDKYPAVMIMGLQRTAPMLTEFTNCIVSGTIDNEFAIASRFLKDYKGTFKNSFIK